MAQLKLIKRYRNRKLYDSERSTYITLDHLRTFLREGREVKVIDQKTQTDITGVILLQLLHETERNARVLPATDLLKEIIRRGDGSFSGFLRTVDGYESRLEERLPMMDVVPPGSLGTEYSVEGVERARSLSDSMSAR